MNTFLKRGLFGVAATVVVAGAVWLEHQNILASPIEADDVEPLAILSDDITAKNQREIESFSVPGFYARFYDNQAAIVQVGDQQYELQENLNDPDSSAHAKVVHNIESGHTIIIFKGMDKPGFDEGAGIFGFVGDTFGHHGDSADGCLSDQVRFFEQEYLRILQDPNVPSVELIGYSIGSTPANYLVGQYGAITTNIADLGVPSGHFVEACENGHFPLVNEEFNANLAANIVGLELRADGLGGAIGDIGPQHGEQITLDENDLNLIGAFHVPQAYEATVIEHFPDEPEAVVVEVSNNESNFEPF